MKLILLSLVTLIFSILNLASQTKVPCDVDNFCKNQQFPYFFCDETGTITPKCSANPYHELNNGLTAIQMDLSCFYYADEYHPEYNDHGEIWNYVIYENEASAWPVFDINNVQTCFDNAIKAWQDICLDCDLTKDFIQKCCIKVQWSREESFFQDEDGIGADINASTTRYVYGGNCQYDCYKTIVYLNQSHAYTGVGDDPEYPYSYSKNFFLTGNIKPNFPYSTGIWTSLTAVF